MNEGKCAEGQRDFYLHLPNTDGQMDRRLKIRRFEITEGNMNG